MHAPSHTILQARHKSVIALFVLGLCAGLVISERVYIARGGRVPKPRFLRTEHDVRLQQLRARTEAKRNAATGNVAGDTVSKASPGSSRGAAAATVGLPKPDFSSPPRNELESLLRRVAPSMEVLVAVANKNVNWDGMLNTFCSGIKRAGVTNHLIMALDEETKAWADANGFNAYLMKIEIHQVIVCWGGRPLSNQDMPDKCRQITDALPTPDTRLHTYYDQVKQTRAVFGRPHAAHAAFITVLCAPAPNKPHFTPPAGAERHG